jgi:aminoglycoside 3-N-acetyltransferase I
LTAADRDLGRTLFALIAEVFEHPPAPLSDAYLDRLLSRADVWALAAFADGVLAGGLTAFELPLTRREEFEIFLYDIAVAERFQRRGVGRRLLETLRTQSGLTVWVPADNEDTHALDFYQATGGEAAPVTIFTFPPSG